MARIHFAFSRSLGTSTYSGGFGRVQWSHKPRIQATAYSTHTPAPPGRMLRYLRFQWSTVNVLPLAPDAYVVRASSALWQVQAKEALALVYAGPGPVEVVRSPAPF